MAEAPSEGANGGRKTKALTFGTEDSHRISVASSYANEQEAPESTPDGGEQGRRRNVTFTGEDATRSADVPRMSRAQTTSSDRLTLASRQSPRSQVSLASSGQEVDISLPVRRAHKVLRKTALASTQNILEKEVLKEVIEETHMRWNGCLMLPVTIAFFTFYSAAVSLHEDITMNHLMDNPIREAILEPEDGVALGDVLTPPEMWEFVETTYLPFFFQQRDSFGRPLAKDRWSSIAEYGRLLGSVEMHLHRSVKKTCDDEFARHLQCHPQSELTTEPFGAPLADLPPIALGPNWTYFNESSNDTTSLLNCESEGFTVNHCLATRRRLTYMMEDLKMKMPVASQGVDSYMFLLSRHQSFDTLLARVHYLRDRGWIDDQSTQLTFKAVAINGQLMVPRVQFVTTSFFFSRGGGIYSSLRVQTAALEFFVHSLSYLVDCLFSIMLIITTIYMAYELCKAIKQGAVWFHFTGVNIVTWLTCLVGWGNIFGMLYVETLRSKVRANVQDYFSNPTDQASMELYDSVEQMMSIMNWLRTVVADAHLLFMCRCFASLQWQPRLAVVSQTLLACSSDLFHYLIVFVPTFMAFAIAGMMIFGRQLSEFSTLGAAVSTCFKIAMESEFDWHRLSAKDSRTAAAWVCLYILLVVMLMLNMILAIIMDVYQEVRMHSGASMTVFNHLLYLYRSLVYRHHWVSDEQLMAQVEEMPATIVLSEFRLALPEMHHYQLEYLMQQAANKAQKISRVGINKAHTVQMVAAIVCGLEGVIQNLEQLKKRGWMGKGIEAGSNENREWVREILTSVAVQSHWMGLTAKHMNTLQLRMEGVSPEEEAKRQKLRKQTAGRSVKVRDTNKS